MKVLYPKVILSIAGFYLGLSSHVAVGKTISNVELKSPLLGKSFITAELVGLLPDSCTEVKEVRYEPGPFVKRKPEVNLFITTGNKGELCGDATVPYVKGVFLGDLSQGVYTLNVFKDNLLTFRKRVSIPEDVGATSLDFKRKRQMEDQATASKEIDLDDNNNT